MSIIIHVETGMRTKIESLLFLMPQEKLERQHWHLGRVRAIVVLRGAPWCMLMIFFAIMNILVASDPMLRLASLLLDLPLKVVPHKSGSFIVPMQGWGLQWHRFWHMVSCAA